MEERGFKIFVPDEEEPDKDSEVFFNDKMRRNRDLSVIAGKVFHDQIDVDDFKACDALSASGIRGFRYSEFAGTLLLNDSKPDAVESIEKGLDANSIEAEVTDKDANIILSENRNRFHLIDIDPFGSFSRFLDSTVRASNHQSLVGLTATDNAVAAGSYRKTCLRRYSSKPLKNSLMHEVGLRIYLKEAFENFARFDMAFEPKVCWHERHYTRLIGRVTASKSRANKNLDNIGHLSFCEECRWRKLERVEECASCGSSEIKHAGPLWTGKFTDRRFTEKMIEEMPDEWEESHELLEKIHSEAEILTPFYDVHKLSSVMKISSPKRDPVIEALREKGYPVSRTHFSPTGIRTDAPIEDVKEIIRKKSR